MKARSRELLDRAIAAMVAAIEIYNKPDFAYRGESFVMLAANAWELLLKAKWLAGNRNRLSSLYVRQGGGAKRQRYKKTRSGNPLTHSLMYLAAKLREEGKLDECAFRNLELLTELRDGAVHFYHGTAEFARRLQEIALAAVANFNAAAKEWFGEDLTRFNFYLLPLSFAPAAARDAKLVLNQGEKRFLRFAEKIVGGPADANPNYAVALNVELRFVRSRDSNAAPVRITNDPNAPALRLSEEQIRARYPLDYRALTAECKSRYADFKVDQKYHQLRKGLESDTRYAYLRRLDPDKPKPVKPFFGRAILDEFDKHYKRKMQRT